MVSIERYTEGLRGVSLKVVGAYAAIYLIWGSTFLALRYAVDSMPPLLTVALRSLIAGVALLGWALGRGARLTWRDWRGAAVGGVCFFCLGHGSLAWAEQHISSGLAAVLLAMIPGWVAALGWLRGGARPSALTALGMLLSFGGVVALVLPAFAAGGDSQGGLAAAVAVGGAVAWAAGSVHSSSAAPRVPPAALAGMQLVSGGALVLAASLLGGEGARVSPGAIAPHSLLALAYLVVAGSLVAFSAYIWLLRVSAPARVATYAYVNPVVALLLGWAVGGEALAPSALLPALAVLAGVVVIVTARQRG